MRTFNGDPALKERALENLRQHRAADGIARGEGYMDVDVNGGAKGCALGCTLVPARAEDYPPTMLEALKELVDELDYHDLEWSTAVGRFYCIPAWLARLEEGVFETMPKDEALDWPARLVAAIPVGVPFQELAVRVRDQLSDAFGMGIANGRRWPHGVARAVGDRLVELLRGVEIEMPAPVEESGRLVCAR